MSIGFCWMMDVHQQSQTRVHSVDHVLFDMGLRVNQRVDRKSYNQESNSHRVAPFRRLYDVRAYFWRLMVKLSGKTMLTLRLQYSRKNIRFQGCSRTTPVGLANLHKAVAIPVSKSTSQNRGSGYSRE